MSVGKKIKTTFSVWGESIRTMKRYPKVFLPFGIVALFQVALLFLLFWAPRSPISVVMAPPIRKFWGEMYLHYPVNFLLLPKLFNYGNIVLRIILESLMAGVTVAMVVQALKKFSPRFRTNCKKGIRKYITLVAVWVMLFALITIVFRVPVFLITKYYSNYVGIFRQANFLRVAVLSSIFIAIMIEALLAYTVPAVMIEHKRTFKAIKRSFSVVRGISLETFLLVLIPTLLTLIPVFLKLKLPALIDRFFPEVTLYVIILGILISLFSNFLLIISVTILFLRKTETSDEGASK